MKKININQLVWFLMLLVISFYIFYLIVSGDIKSFIHPRMLPFMYLALSALMVMAAFQATRIFEDGSRRLRKGNIVFLIPVMAVALFNPGQLHEHITESKGIVISRSQIEIENKDTINLETFVKNGIIILNEDNYTQVLYSIWSSPQQYNGRRIAMQGFVSNSEDTNKGRMIIARMIISCCAADSVIMGLPAVYTGERIQDDQWVSITGTIKTMEFLNPSTTQYEIMPGISIDNLEIIEKPENPYVYP